jgi:hypothetical protein
VSIWKRINWSVVIAYPLGLFFSLAMWWGLLILVSGMFK